VNSLQIHYDFRRFTINSLSVLRIPFVFANSKNSQPREFHTHQLSFPRISNRYSIIFPYSLWIHYQLHALTIDQLCFENWELIHLFRELTMNSLLFSRFTMDPWSFPPIHYEFTISYIDSTSTVNSVSFLRFTMALLSFPRIHYEFTIRYINSTWTVNSANSLWILSDTQFSRIHFPFRDINMDPLSLVNSELIPYLFREFTMSSLSVIRIHHGFITFFANSLWFHCHFRKRNMYWLSVTSNSIFFTRTHYEFTIIFVGSQWIHYLLRLWHNFFTQSLRIYYLYRDFVHSRFSSKSLWIYSLLREFTMILQSFSQT